MLKLALIVLVVLSLVGLIYLILQSKKMLNDVVKQHKNLNQPHPEAQKKTDSKKKR